MKAPLFLVCLAACGSTTPTPAAPTASPVPSNAVEEPTPEPVPEPPPPEAPAFGEVIAEGTGVRILEIGKDDAYAIDAPTIVGLVCSVTGDLHVSGGGYYAGGARCSDGTDYYFYQVKVAPAETPPVTAAATTTSAGASLGDLPQGTTFTIVALSPEDAYYDDAAKILNLSCTATGPIDESSPGLYSGSVKCSDGADYYFYQVAIASVVRP